MAPDHKLRLKALRAGMKDAGVEAFFVRSRVNVRYLCGFDGTYGILLVDAGAARLITDGRYTERAEALTRGAKVVTQPMTGADDWFRDLLKASAYRTIAFEGSMTFDEYEVLRRRARAAKSKLEPHTAMIHGLRAVKDDGEVKTIAKAARLADTMMAAAIGALGTGARESDISRVIRHCCEHNGGEAESFPNIVASGTNSSRPHHSPGARRLRRGDMVTIDLGGMLDGYCSDLTRNPVLGNPAPEFEKMYAACLEANELALKACKAGVACKDLDAVAREHIASRGYGKYFTHGLGHGVGMEIHEAPRLNATSTDTLQPGNVVTIEPGIYVPGLGGVRIEDLVVVTAGKPKVLSRTPKGLTIIPA